MGMWGVALSGAVGAGIGGILAVVGTLIGISYTYRLNQKSAAQQIRAAAYNEFLTRAQTVVLRAQTLGLTARVRSGLSDRLDILFYRRPPVDPLKLHDWMDKDFQPLLKSMSQIRLIGSKEAITTAEDILSTCEKMQRAATLPKSDLGWFDRTFKTERWVTEQPSELQSALQSLQEQCTDFSREVRPEIGEKQITHKVSRPGDLGLPSHDDR